MRNSVFYYLILLVLISLFTISCENTGPIKANKKVSIKQSEKIVYKEQEKAKKIDKYFRNLHRKRVFNGNVLVAQQGKVIFQESYGYKDIRTKEPLELN